MRFNWLYLKRPPWDTGVSPPELTSFLESVPPGRALDVGCGTGTNLVTIASFGWQVVGVDLVWLPVLRARWKLHRAGLSGEVKIGDVAGGFNLGLSFDLVLDIGCFHSLGNQERDVYRQKLAGWLKPDGTYLLYAHRQTTPDSSQGIIDQDLNGFSSFLCLQWRQDSHELRPDGGGGFPATWARFKRN